MDPNSIGANMRREASTSAAKYKQLSLRDAGVFDQKFFQDKQFRIRMLTCSWTAVSKDRASRGVSRRARILQQHPLGPVSGTRLYGESEE